MANKSFLISFVYRLDQGRIAIDLWADVEIQHDSSYYIVRNIRPLHQSKASAIPEVKLTKKASVWVHLDSQKPTELTLCIGQAIDALDQR